MRWHGTIKQEHQRLLNCRLSSCPPCRACPSYRRKCMQTIPNIKSMSPYFRKKKSLAPTPLLSFVKEEKDVFFFLPSFLCELEGASIIGKENTRRKQKTCVVLIVEQLYPAPSLPSSRFLHLTQMHTHVQWVSVIKEQHGWVFCFVFFCPTLTRSALH